MGFDRCRFVDENVDEELVCTICSGVFEDPLQIPACEHEFCSECIKPWLARQQTCPMCRYSPITVHELKPGSRILRNLLSRLSMVCENAQLGCKKILKFDSLAKHGEECEFSPTRLVSCDQGCGLRVPWNQLQNHNCIKELRSHFDKEMAKLEQKFNDMKSYAETLNAIVKQVLPTSTSSSTALAASSSATLTAGVSETRALGRLYSQWHNSLARARVLRWGGLISTPDEPNQECIRSALVRLGCPLGILHELVRNSHEHNWPAGLASLEIRQLNRPLFENYVVRKLPNLQVVVVMACENQHMQEDMIAEPGIIMIFAHGVGEI